MKTKLSIVTVTFNRGEKLKKTIESIQSQKFHHLEHIIVDNLSNDSTQDIVHSYKKTAQYPVLYIREKDSGIYEAMNKGLKRAVGEWTHTLNSDDYYTNNGILKSIFETDLSQYDIIVCPVIMKSKYGGKQNYFWKPEFNQKIQHYNFPHSGTLIKKSFYEEYGYYDENFKIISDSLHQIKTYPNAKYFIFDKPIIFMGSGGVSSNMSFRHFIERSYLIFFFHKFPFFQKLKFFFNDVISFIVKKK